MDAEDSLDILLYATPVFVVGSLEGFVVAPFFLEGYLFKGMRGGKKSDLSNHKASGRPLLSLKASLRDKGVQGVTR